MGLGSFNKHSDQALRARLAKKLHRFHSADVIINTKLKKVQLSLN